MAANERLENTVAAESDNGVVVWMGLVEIIRVCLKAIIETSGESAGIDIIKVGGCHHFAQIPEFHCLVLAIGENISSVAFAVNVGQALRVAHEDSSFTSVAHRPSVPDSEGGVI